MTSNTPRLVAVTALLCVAWPTAASAQTPEQTVFVGEAAYTMPLGAPERDRFQPGGTLAAAGYRSLHPLFSMGLRFRGSLFGNGSAPDDPIIEDEDVGGLYTASLALRLRPFGDSRDFARFTGPYVEVAVGGALTEDLVRPVGEAALGWIFEAGDVGIGPVVRYQWVPHEGELQDDDGHFFIGGVEVVIADARGRVEDETQPVRAVDPCEGQEEDVDGFQDEDGCPDPDNDGDGILDVDDACPNIPETFNGYNDGDGCPDSSTLEVIDDRVVIQDDVFFDYDQAVVRPHGHRVIDQLVALWQAHPEWDGMIIEGHADARGSEPYNDDLSRRRAEAVRAALVAHGMSDERVRIEALGERDPVVPGAETEAEHQLNRRVEFIVERHRPVVRHQDQPPTTAPEPTVEIDAEGDDQ